MNDLSSKTESLIDTIRKESGFTHSQLQIWTGQKIHPKSPLYNMTFAIVIEGEIDPGVFANAWLETVREEESLRLSVVETNGFPRTNVLETQNYEMQTLDYRERSNPDADFRALAEEKARTLIPLDSQLAQSIGVQLSDLRFGWILNQHHLVTDASSTVGLFKTVSNNYEKLSRQEQSTPSQKCYRDIARDQEEASKPNDHWEKKKKQHQSRSNPIYGKKGDPSKTNSVRHQVKLNEQQSDAIRKLAEHESFASFFPDISIYAVFSTLLGAFLRRATNQESITFDSPAGNRVSKAAKQSLGCFIEIFPLDMEFHSGDTFASLGQRCMEEVSSFLTNVSPGKSNPNGATSSNAVLNYFPLSFGKFSGHSVTADWIHSEHIDGAYDFQLQVHDYNGTGNFVLQFDLSSSTFSDYDQKRVVEHFQSLLNTMLQDLDTQIDSIPILTETEQDRVIYQFNNTSRATGAANRTVIDFIAERAKEQPNDTAIREGSKSLTYRELWEKSGQIARALSSVGVSAGENVALLLPRSADYVLAILGVLRACCAYVPVDPKYPQARIDRILGSSNPTVVIAQRDSKEPQDSPSFFSVETLLQIGENLKADLPSPDSNQLSYIIYTSGSTGEPKGVEVEHLGLLEYLIWAERVYVRGHRLSFPLFTSVAFDLTVTSVFLPLMTGGKLIVYPQIQEEVDHGVIDVINENEVDFIKLTPSHLNLLRQLDLSESRLSRLVLGGEDLKQKLANEITKQFGKPVELYNEYGPTEAVVGCMIHRHDPSDTHLSVPIGKPADNVEILLLNDSFQPTPEGTPGEMFIARTGIARGYHRDGKKTSSSFLESELTRYGRLYRTGDLARFAEDSNLIYLGRIDSQVKLAGFRVELGEIETTIGAHPKIRSAHVALLRKSLPEKDSENAAHCSKNGISTNYPSIGSDSPRTELTAYYEADEKIPNSELIALVDNELPVQMRPAHFVHLKTFPLTRNGKVDTNALPPPDAEENTSKDDFELPEGEVEEHVFEVWAKYLGTRSFGTKQSFFQIGGVSLAAMEIVLQLCKDFEIDLPLQCIFQNPTVAKLSQFIESTIMEEIDKLSEEEAQQLIDESV
ncbi:amino acid adenylation domain-containing protein [Pelagicoccus sp. SDUM812002]|uniref:non-ribosomal peptide synthetase n=1 Tax=Pelagicoccus sp. SDUM812002 TaxID=3041266 RepID=UPI00280F0BF9|nr:amino acid adenylation domain-containing protein [Pelagicoccus sp. SDUM812002]MDQ8185696.1 amino acid adenylation domain-containing protein [Pelagicoccus sp. SDUM812002]